MSDRDDIVQLLYQYAERVDLGDLKGVGALFEHATYRTDGVDDVLRGADVHAVMRRTIRFYDGVPRTKHLVTNAIVDVEHDGATASSRSYFTVLQAPPGEPPVVIITGRYHDRFERVDGAWRFADRLIHLDQVGDLSAHLHLDRLGW